MIGARLLPHTVTWQQPGTRTDGYGNTTADWTGATETALRGFMQPLSGQENTDARDAQIGDWVLFTDEPAISGADRIVWAGDTYEVIGPPARFDDLGGFHHIEARLRIVEG